jgi:demethylmenaquinone methyltransferase/2-methoxy-6-polyprenyl-1,4-benzoquinol methylase
MSKNELNTTSKKEQVREMFDSIAPTYVFLNSVLSFGIDKIWRKRAVRFLKKKLKKTRSPLISDIACGTADFSLALMRIPNAQVVGTDLSEQMLNEGRKIVANKRTHRSRIFLEQGDAENLKYEDNYFDAAVCGFGVRNFENLEKGLSEILRTIKEGSYFLILEFSEPKFFLFKALYKFYSFVFMPFIGKLVSKSDSAYTYLPNSIREFKKDEELCEVMRKVGFSEATYKHMTMGIVSLYIGKK